MPEYRCKACGSDVAEGSAACPECGAPLASGTDATAAFAPVAEAEERSATTPVAAGTGPALVVKKGPDAGERLAIAADVVTIGRDPGSDIFLNDITVSRRHARIERTGKAFTLSDVGSLNGTYVNGQRIETRTLDAGDEIQIGKFRLLFAQ